MKNKVVKIERDTDGDIRIGRDFICMYGLSLYIKWARKVKWIVFTNTFHEGYSFELTDPSLRKRTCSGTKETVKDVDNWILIDVQKFFNSAYNEGYRFVHFEYEE